MQDYKRMNRREMEDYIAAQDKKIEELTEALEQAQKELEDRALQIEEPGNLAEASLRINGVFEAAQNAADQFLENIKLRKEETDRACEQRDGESREKAIELLESTQAKCRAMEEETRQKCSDMTAAVKREAEEYWDKISERMEKFYEEHRGLKEMLDIPSKLQKEFSGKEDEPEESPEGE